MKRLSSLLETSLPNSSGPRFKVAWSQPRTEALHRMHRNEQPVRDPVEAALAPALLMCSNGDFEQAELHIIELLRLNIDRLRQYPEAFICFLQALFVVQRFDLVAVMLKDRHDFVGDLEIQAEEGRESPACVRWSISASNAYQFIFDLRALQDDHATHKILMLHWAFPMFANFTAAPEKEMGSVLINQFDIGVRPGLAYCDNRPDYFLVPDLIFVSSGGYRYARSVLAKDAIPWHDRKRVAFWRGATTGPKSGPRDWQSLDRVKLCEIARRHERTSLIDAGISQVVNFADPTVADEIKAAGLMKGFVPWQEWGRYRYHIDIDGNSCPYSNLFQRLLTGSPVLKVQSSRGLI